MLQSHIHEAKCFNCRGALSTNTGSCALGEGPRSQCLLTAMAPVRISWRQLTFPHKRHTHTHTHTRSHTHTFTHDFLGFHFPDLLTLPMNSRSRCLDTCVCIQLYECVLKSILASMQLNVMITFVEHHLYLFHHILQKSINVYLCAHAH
jgi:hypothetical protein